MVIGPTCRNRDLHSYIAHICSGALVALVICLKASLSLMERRGDPKVEFNYLDQPLQVSPTGLTCVRLPARILSFQLLSHSVSHSWLKYTPSSCIHELEMCLEAGKRLRGVQRTLCSSERISEVTGVASSYNEWT